MPSQQSMPPNSPCLGLHPRTPRNGKLLVGLLQLTALGPAATRDIPTKAPMVVWVVDTGSSQ